LTGQHLGVGPAHTAQARDRDTSTQKAPRLGIRDQAEIAGESFLIMSKFF
jgi:hypothetical protein